MGSVSEPSNAYRIVIAFESGQKVADPQRYDSFAHAQGRVASLVREHGRDGDLKAIILAQRVTDESSPRWSVAHTWNGSTISRIQMQLRAAGVFAAPGKQPVVPTKAKVTAPPRKIKVHNTSDGDAPVAKEAVTPAVALVSSPAPAAASVPAEAAPAVAAPAPTAHRLRRLPALHKPTRWQFAGTAVLLAAAVVAVFLVETGGRPFQLLAAVDAAGPTIKHELPFDAQEAAESEQARPPEPIMLTETSDADGAGLPPLFPAAP